MKKNMNKFQEQFEADAIGTDDCSISCFQTASIKPKFMSETFQLHQTYYKSILKLQKAKKQLKQLQLSITCLKIPHYNLDFDPNRSKCVNFEKKIVYMHGNKIEGIWKNNKLQGFAKIQYSTGQYFEGQYSDGVKIQGLVKFKDGTEYYGGFKDNLFHDIGCLTDPSQRQITCKWNLGRPSHKVKIQYPSGDIYYGQVSRLQKHGEGYLFLKNGGKYVGQFKNGIINGFGTYFQDNRKLAEGIWVNGVLEVEKNVKIILCQTFKQLEMNDIVDRILEREQSFCFEAKIQ